MKFFLSILVFLVSCESPREGISYPMSFSLDSSASEKKELCEEFSFQGMGTIWRVVYCSSKKTVQKESLKSSLIAEVSLYDETFSTWSEESELSRHLKKDFKKKRQASSLFLESLLLAKEFYELTEGAFDITLGTGSLKKLEIKKENFRFLDSPPKTLDFNGFVKGAAVASLARVLKNSGISVFYINAGNGNLAYRVSSSFSDFFLLDESFFKKGRDQVYFLSQSGSVQSHTGEDHQHIKDPKEERSFKEEARVLCFSDFKNSKNWERLGALADAFSTALTVDPSLKVPKSCVYAP